MKSVSESMKEVESKKSLLQEQVDQLNEDCARLKAQGSSATLQCICLSPLACEWFCILGCNSCIAKTRPIATDRVVWSVCWSVCVLVTMAEPIRYSFWCGLVRAKGTLWNSVWQPGEYHDSGSLFAAKWLISNYFNHLFSLVVFWFQWRFLSII